MDNELILRATMLPVWFKQQLLYKRYSRAGTSPAKRSGCRGHAGCGRRWRTIAKNLMRAHELGTQAGNDTYSYAERRLIRQEIAAIWKEIDRVAQSTTFNGIEMLTLSPKQASHPG
ncbi:MAG: hypothetical protein R2857_07470 [Vampirovibrionales bacterium]